LPREQLRVVHSDTALCAGRALDVSGSVRARLTPGKPPHSLTPAPPPTSPGDVDHIGSIGKRQHCPTREELRSDRAARLASARAGADAASADAASSSSGASAATSSSTAASSATSSAEWSPSDPEHLADLRRRAQLSRTATKESVISGGSGARAVHGAQHPYETLGVARDATAREVRRAYLTLSTRLHPDRNAPEVAQDAADAFADLGAAYAVLSDQVAREAFDAEAAGGHAFFNDEASFAASGQTFANNLYDKNGLVMELTESSFPVLVAGERVWLVQFYSPWCGHCIASAPTFKALAEALTEDEVDVGAVNCHKWPAVCQRFDVRAYPSVRMVGAGMNNDAPPGQDLHNVEGMKAWVLETAVEWRWLFAAANLAPVAGEAGFAGAVLDSQDFWLLLLLDGLDAGPSRVAKTNLMRLGAAAAGRVRVGVVDCEAEEPDWEAGGLCARLGAPRPPHAPQLRAFHAGNKTRGDVGEVLFDPALVESHVALPLVEAVLRLSGAGKKCRCTEGAEVASDGGELMAPGAAKPSWEKNKKEDVEEPTPPPPPPRKPRWNGPAPRAIPAGGWGGGGAFHGGPMGAIRG
jgi:thiol-disulfide isomerase/thioredoxin